MTSMTDSIDWIVPAFIGVPYSGSPTAHNDGKFKSPFPRTACAETHIDPASTTSAKKSPLIVLRLRIFDLHRHAPRDYRNVSPTNAMNALRLTCSAACEAGTTFAIRGGG
jgi:hypothetical protein